MAEDMQINPQRAKQLAENIASITSRINAVSKGGKQLLEKSKILPRSIQWHMIGGLQSNKCKQLAEQIPNLWCVSSVDSEKKANELEKGRKALVEKDGDKTRDQVIKELGWREEQLELSMGMSADFEGAVKMGSDEVRVGSQIFGERPQKKDAVIKEKEAQEKS
ncbi:unnamed protein product [Alternaria alternata]